jgi:hypothetical protein
MSILGLNLDWSGVGAMATAVAAIIALLFAWQQISAARVASAQDIYKEFLVRSLEHKDFIYPVGKVDTEDEKFDGKSDRFWHYEVYVDLMLTAFEQLYDLRPRPKEELARFERYIGGYLYSHEPYLMSDYFKENFVSEMSPQFWGFANEALRKERQRWVSKK